MKEILKSLAWPLVFAVTLILFGLHINSLGKKLDDIEPQIITVTDTVTEWKADTVYFKRHDTVRLVALDTVNDTLIKLDSVLVQVPISEYVFDSTLVDTNSEIHFKAVLSGFDVSLDTLYLNTKIMQQETNLMPSRRSFWSRLNPAVGVGVWYDEGLKVYPLVGVGISLW